jgi:hypothetical protein
MGIKYDCVPSQCTSIMLVLFNVHVWCYSISNKVTQNNVSKTKILHYLKCLGHLKQNKLQHLCHKSCILGNKLHYYERKG